MKHASPKQHSKQKRQTDKQSYVPLITLILIVIIFFFLVSFNMLNAIPFLLIPFFISDLSAPPVLLFNIAFVTSVVGTTYWLWIRKQSQRQVRIISVIATLIITIVLTLLLAKFTIPFYQKYQVTHVPVQMKSFLENKYREPFEVVEAKYEEVRILGDAKGVRATAYPLSEPSYRFSISQDHDGNFEEEYVDLYGEKISHKVSTQLQADLKQEFNTQITLLNVSVREYDRELFVGAMSSAKTISLMIPELFRVDKWQEYESMLKRLTVLLNKKPYDSYQYYIQITPTDDTNSKGFFCNFLPSQRINNEFEKRLNYCVAAYNSIKGREKIEQ